MSSYNWSRDYLSLSSMIRRGQDPRDKEQPMVDHSEDLLDIMLMESTDTQSITSTMSLESATQQPMDSSHPEGDALMANIDALSSLQIVAPLLQHVNVAQSTYDQPVMFDTPIQTTTYHHGAAYIPPKTTQFAGAAYQPIPPTQFAGAAYQPTPPTQFAGAAYQPTPSTQFAGAAYQPTPSTQFAGAAYQPIPPTQFAGAAYQPTPSTQFAGAAYQSTPPTFRDPFSTAVNRPTYKDLWRSTLTQSTPDFSVFDPCNKLPEIQSSSQEVIFDPDNAAIDDQYCVLCKKNGEQRDFYVSHALKDSRGKVVCPILRKYVCPTCSATGDNAHTIKHCPKSSSRRSSIEDSRSRVSHRHQHRF